MSHIPEDDIYVLIKVRFKDGNDDNIRTHHVGQRNDNWTSSQFP
jgi:hypothetical protein